MRKLNKVSIFLVIVAFIALLIAIFAWGRFSKSDSSERYNDQYEENIKLLDDTIRELRNNISRYEKEIEKVESEREKIKEELDLILKRNETTDSNIINGDIDYNIEFLSKFLSEKDFGGERYSSSHNSESAKDNKQVSE